MNLLNSPKKTTNQNQTEICSTSKKNKTLNKTKTNTDILISGHSLLLLRKIQQENSNQKINEEEGSPQIGDADEVPIKVLTPEEFIYL